MTKRDDHGELDQRVVRALGHPLRVEILRELEKGPSSPIRLADRIGGKLSSISYHARVLLEHGCIETSKEIPRRGAMEHIYRLSSQGVSGARTWKEVPRLLRSHCAGTALAGFAARAVEALDNGTVETRKGSGITWLPLHVDEEGWKEMRRALDKVEGRFRAIADKSADRMEDPKEGIPIVVAVAAFETSGEDTADRS